MGFRNGPSVTVDVIIEYNGGIVLVERKNIPRGWAIPGGFVEYNETLERAVSREAKEETNLSLTGLKQLHTYSDPERDPRGHTVSTVFTAKGRGVLKAASDAKKAAVFFENKLPREIAFDHSKIIWDYFCHKKGKEPRW